MATPEMDIGGNKALIFKITFIYFQINFYVFVHLIHVSMLFWGLSKRDFILRVSGG